MTQPIDTTYEIDRNHPLRRTVEDGIISAYARSFGASISAFPDRLLCILDEAGIPSCAAGLRHAEDGFFSDFYMDRPLIKLLNPGPIVEVGPLAALQPGTSWMLVSQIISLCLKAGAEWAVFTATKELRQLLTHRALPFIGLSPANRERVPEPGIWGDYYQHDPWVCAVARTDLMERI